VLLRRCEMEEGVTREDAESGGVGVTLAGIPAVLLKYKEYLREQTVLDEAFAKYNVDGEGVMGFQGLLAMLRELAPDQRRAAIRRVPPPQPAATTRRHAPGDRGPFAARPAQAGRGGRALRAAPLRRPRPRRDAPRGGAHRPAPAARAASRTRALAAARSRGQGHGARRGGGGGGYRDARRAAEACRLVDCPGARAAARPGAAARAILSDVCSAVVDVRERNNE
jgi:hypothetical protein